VQRRDFVATLAGAAAPAFAEPPARNLILVTADGLRWQEVFRGAEPQLLEDPAAGMKDAAEVRQRFEAATAEERRRRLMPFLWSVVARQGTLLGNRDKGSEVTLQNRHWFSYPGYAEILTGRPHDGVIDSNDLRPSPVPTLLEVLRRAWRLAREKAAVFGSWEVFEGIGAHEPGSIFLNAGYRRAEPAGGSPRLAELSRQQFELLTPWRSVRHDFFTFEMALEFFRAAQPRVLYVALGETDDWAHDRRYDRYLETIFYFDQCLRRLWEAIEQAPDYRGRTALVATSDHGRGGTREDWTRHGARVEGARYTWLAAIGPLIAPLGEAGAGYRATASDIAPTMLALAGVDYRELAGVAGAPLARLLRAAQ
jgi:hypothetical protein